MIEGSNHLFLLLGLLCSYKVNPFQMMLQLIVVYKLGVKKGSDLRILPELVAIVGTKKGLPK